jgi:hypothetical protein
MKAMEMGLMRRIIKNIYIFYLDSQVPDSHP